MKTIYSVMLLFFIFSNIFHFGQIFYLFDNIDLKGVNIVLNRVPISDITDGIYYCLIAHIFLLIGVLFSTETVKNKIEHHIVNNERPLYIKLAILLIIIGVFPKLYYDYQTFKYYLIGGYAYTWKLYIPGYMSFIAKMFNYGLLILFVSSNKFRYKLLIFLVVVVFFEALNMISGYRSRSVILVFMYLLIYLVDNSDKVSIKNIAIYVGSIYIALIIINIISLTRINPDIDLQVLYGYIMENQGFQVIYKSIAQMGGTLLSVVYALKYFPQYNQPVFGLNYLVSFITVFPNIGGIMSYFTEMTYYITKFPHDAGRYLGGSYIGETYYSFNILGPFVMVVIGNILMKISRAFEYSISQKVYYKTILLIPIVLNIMWWNRDYFGSMIREIIWYYFAVQLLLQFIKRVSKANYINEVK